MYTPLMDMIGFRVHIIIFSFAWPVFSLGMVLWRHKTLKIKFKLAILCITLVCICSRIFGYGLGKMIV